MSQLSGVRLVLLAVLAMMPASAHAISITNHSFENPALPNNGASVGNPTGWSGTGTRGWVDNGWGGGAINITNLDLNQAGWFNTDVGTSFFQVLSDTFTIGNSYDLTVGVVKASPGWTGSTTNNEFQVQLYYGAFNVVTFGSALAQDLNDSTGALTDVVASLATVQAGDPWAGQPIGIRLYSAAEAAGNPNNDWAFDNVRLESSVTSIVPEPETIALFSSGLLGLLLFYWRRAL